MQQNRTWYNKNSELKTHTINSNVTWSNWWTLCYCNCTLQLLALFIYRTVCLLTLLTYCFASA